jgi:hypothetical protein
LFAGHAGGEQQRPHAIVAGKRTDAAFDAGHQAQALAGEAEVAHGRVPSEKPSSAFDHQAVSILNAVAILKFQHRRKPQKDGKPALNGSTWPPAPIY